MNKLKQAAESFKMSNEDSIKDRYSAIRVNSIIGGLASIGISVTQVALPFVVFASTKSTKLLVAYTSMFLILGLAKVVDFIHQRSLKKDLELEYANFLKHLESNGITKEDLKSNAKQFMQ